MKFEIGQIWYNRIGEKCIIKHIDYIDRKIVCGVESATTIHEYTLNWDGTYHNHKYDLVEFDNVNINESKNIYMIINSSLKENKTFDNLTEAKEYATYLNTIQNNTTFVVKLIDSLCNKTEWNKLRSFSEYINMLLKDYKIFYQDVEIVNSCVHECSIEKCIKLETIDGKSAISLHTINEANIVIDEIQLYEKSIISNLLKYRIKQILE